MSTERIKGHSQSLNKTIREIRTFLEDTTKRPRDVKLRVFLHEKLADLSEYWYEHGVRRGHIECYKEWDATGKVSKKFRYKGTREFFDGQQRRVRVTSKIKASR